jgi:DNA-binding FadR family transcriptional regulator
MTVASPRPTRERSRAPKAAVRLAQRIVREIRRRGLGPGDKLISEEKMVARYGFARGTLREALRFLELQGVLRIKSGPGGGPVVSRPDARHLASGLSLLLEFAGAPLRALFEARCALEPGMASWAARRAGRDDLDALRDCLDRQRRHLDDAPAFHDETRRFHDLVALASGNPVFAYLTPALRWIAEGAAPADDVPERRRALRGHEAVVRAIEGGDGEQAARTMEQLVSAGLDLLERTRPDSLDRPVSWSDLER